MEIGATRGVVQSVFAMLQDGATHLGVATDHVIESFRNDMWPGYKSSAGMDPLLLAQFDLLEAALRAMGVAVWPMVEVEADDGLASAAAVGRCRPTGRPGDNLHPGQGSRSISRARSSRCARYSGDGRQSRYPSSTGPGMST